MLLMDLPQHRFEYPTDVDEKIKEMERKKDDGRGERVNFHIRQIGREIF
jgi:hypothetical protein